MFSGSGNHRAAAESALTAAYSREGPVRDAALVQNIRRQSPGRIPLAPYPAMR
jgi:hypothetical protein